MKVRKKKKIPHFTYEHSPQMDDEIDAMFVKLESNTLSENEVLDELYEIAESHPLYPTVFYAIGTVYAFNNEHEDSIYYFTKAINLNPFFIEAMLNNATCYYTIGDIVGYLTWLFEIVEIGDKKDEVVIEAITRLDKMKVLIKEHHGIDLHSYLKYEKRFKFAQEKMQEYQWDKAIEVFKSLLKKMPDDLAIWNKLAICYANQGEEEQALEYAKKALEIKEDLKSRMSE